MTRRAGDTQGSTDRRPSRGGGLRRVVPGPPLLNPAARLLWRSPTCAQLELGGDAVVVDGPGVPVVRALARRTGELPAADAVLGALTEAGLAWPGTAGCSDDPDPRLAPSAPRLAAEFAAAATRHGERASEVLAARRYCSVTIRGAGRAGPQLGALLAAAGVGRVQLVEPSRVRSWQATPGGVLPTDEGRTLGQATADAVLRAAPDTEVGPPPQGTPPDLVVLACDAPIDPDQRDRLHHEGRVHLAVRLAPDCGVVGPLVIPGLTSCLRCADLHRLDRDPAWTALAVQLTVPKRAPATADVALCAVVAGVAAQQALAFLDGVDTATVEGTLEQHPPDWRVRRRSWPVHPDCDCTRITPAGRMAR